MAYVALEWDHKIAKSWIGWLVVECAHVEEKFGGLQAMPPRRDVAYFVDPRYAERDAKAFADHKNSEVSRGGGSIPPNVYGACHAAFPWDHSAFAPLVQWAVLEFSVDKAGSREDVAYFLDPSFAERDARTFRAIRDAFCASEITERS